MLARISGKVVEKELGAFIIDVNGLGYRVRVLKGLWETTMVGTSLVLRVHHYVSENDEGLCGFETEEHLRFFTLLLKVPSVGVKTALAILDVAPPATLSQAVADDDIALLTKVSGVGKKTAQRILVELKGKLGAPEKRQATGSTQEEAIQALLSIGYTRGRAREAIAALPAGVTSVEEVVRFVLREKEPVR